jgi:hypothetical protein
MDDIIHLNASPNREHAEKKRLTYKDADKYGLFCAYRASDDVQSWVVLPNHVLKLIHETQSEKPMSKFLKLAEEAGFKVRNGEVMDGDDYHIQTDLLQKFYDLVRPKREPLTIDQIKEHYATAKVLDELDVEMSFADFVMLTRYFENLLT